MRSRPPRASTTTTPAKGSGKGLPLRRGSLVAEGTVLGHVLVPKGAKDGHLRFSVQPAGDAGSIDPRPVLANWKELDEALHPQGAKAQSALLGATASDVFLLSKSQLELAVLSDPGIDLDARARHEISSGAIDRRVLAVLAFLSRSGLKPTVQALHRGPRLSTAVGRVAGAETGGAVEISAINGIPIAGHEGAGSITDSTIRTLLTLQGEFVPSQIVSLMKYPAAANTLATTAHADAIQIDFQPTAAALASTPKAVAKARARRRQGRCFAVGCGRRQPELDAVERTADPRRCDPGAEGGREADLGRDPRPPGRTEQPQPRFEQPRLRRTALTQAAGSRTAQCRGPEGASVGRRYPAGGGPAAPPGASPLLGGAAPAGAPLVPGAPAPVPRLNAPLRSLWHLASAALNCALLVSMPFVSNTGPLPEVFGAGTFTPFWRMQVANFASAALKVGLSKRVAPPWREGAAAALFQGCFILRARHTLGQRPGGPACATAAEKAAGSTGGTFLTGGPFRQRDAFFLQAFAERRGRPAFGPLAPVPVLALVVAVVEDELLDELPQAANPSDTSSRARRANATVAGLRLLT